MRLYVLAKSLGVPPGTLLEALRQEGLGVRFGSPATHLLEDDLPAIFHACVRHLPDVVLDAAQREQAQRFATERGEVKARARDATMAAHLHRESAPQPVSEPRDISWSTFLNDVGVVAGGGTLRTSTQLGYDSGEGQIRLCPDPVSSRRVMGRRRLAAETLYDAHGAFDRPVVRDLFLFELSESLQIDLHAGMTSLLRDVQGHLEHMFPISFGEDEPGEDLFTGDPEVTRDLTFTDVASALWFDFNVSELLAKRSSLDEEYDELDELFEPQVSEEMKEIEKMMRGEVPMNYKRLAQLLGDERLAMQSALPHELLRSDEALVEMAREHLGEILDLTRIKLSGSNEHARHEFFIVASTHSAIGYVIVRPL